MRVLTLLALTSALIPITARAEGPANSAATAEPVKSAFTTGVAKGRDLLDTAISASVITSDELAKIGTTSIAETIGNIPGIRAETAGTDGMTSITIRGLPLAADGAKFLQIQEDGLPVLEFGDLLFGASTQFLRTDLSFGQVQAIRGGSASTFASNSPGGVVNFISRTGEDTGGVVQLSTGVNYGMGRADFDYGAKIDDHLRFNIGGFYRQGEGPRATGYDAFKGGQVKFNITRSFEGGYIRLYAKFLDDREPAYGEVPVMVSGTNADPQYAPLPGFDPRTSTAWSRNIPTVLSLGQNNTPETIDLHQGDRSKVRSLGLEAQFEVAGFVVTDRFRYAGISGSHNEQQILGTLPAAYAAPLIGGPGAILTYADGPAAGQVVASPATLGGNGIAAETLSINSDVNSLNNLTNELRASRGFTIGHGKLTTTSGLYTSSQDIDRMWNFVTTLSDYAANGNSTLLNVTTARGFPVTQQGVLAYSILGHGGLYHRRYDVNFRVVAPFGSVNYLLGKLAIGGSLRYDFGKVSGSTYGSDLGGTRVGIGPYDLNGNGAISLPESQTAQLPLTQPGAVGYSYGYLSYSLGTNYRFAQALSGFARYSKGARASADRNLYPPSLNPVSGQLADPRQAYSPVKQAEIGAKFRKGAITAYITGFWASTVDSNYQIGADANGGIVVAKINRTYSAKGVEVEADAHKGPFSLHLGATYTKAKIDSDTFNPAENGLTPRHQPAFAFTALPQVETKYASFGANVIGVSSSYAQDSDLLKQPGYVLVNPFIQVRPLPRVTAAINVYNLFNRLAFVEVGSSAIPTNGVVNAQVLNGRTVTGSLRLTF